MTAPEAFSEVWDPEIGMDSRFVPALIMVSPDFMTLVYDLPDCYAVGFFLVDGSSGGFVRLWCVREMSLSHSPVNGGMR